MDAGAKAHLACNYISECLSRRVVKIARGRGKSERQEIEVNEHNSAGKNATL